jgi:hypothetical protein
VVEFFRAVGSDEAADIRLTGQYRVIDGMSQGKYFYPTAAQALRFLGRGWARVVTAASFPYVTVAMSEIFEAAAEGRVVFIAADRFAFGPVRILVFAE